MSTTKRTFTLSSLILLLVAVAQLAVILVYGQEPLSHTESIGVISSFVMFVMGLFVLIEAPEK